MWVPLQLISTFHADVPTFKMLNSLSQAFGEGILNLNPTSKILTHNF